MASRMTISSLLCEEQPTPVVLAPHLRSQRPSSSNPFPLSPSPSTKPPYIGLDALVHAATEERRRLSGGSATTDSDAHSRPSPLLDHHPPLPFHRHHDYIHSPDNDHSLRSSPAFSPNPQPQHRHRLILDDPPTHHRPDDIPHRPAPGYFPLPTHHDHRIHYQLDFQRQQRQHHELLLLQEQHQLQLIAHERKLAILERTPTDHSPPFLTPPSRGPSMPLQLDVPHHHPHQHNLTLSRNPDPLHLIQVTSPSHVTPNPTIKKRRYSDSPIRSVPPHDPRPLPHPEFTTPHPRIAPIDSPPLIPTSPHRPGSGATRKQINVADLITSDRSPSDFTRELLPTLSPLGRRSPPGSQSGRAKAARKSDEGVDPIKELGPERAPQPSPPPPPQDERKRPREDRKKSRSQPVPETPPKVKEPAKAHEEDAHEWFLEHYDEYPSKGTHPPPPSSSPPIASLVRLSNSPAPKKPTPSSITMPDAASALELELEALMAEVPVVVGKVEPDLDMDVDLAVTELVAETLDAEQSTKREDVGMEVDDELLSLVDDRPPPPPQASRRSSSGTNVPASIKPPSLRVVGDSDPRHTSPAVRPSSTRPTSERGSMPPPASVAPGRAKDKGDRAESVSATAKKKPAKPAAKPKATTAPTAKPRVKPGPKSKPRGTDNPATAPMKSSKSAAVVPKKTTASRSRSGSVMPGGSAGPETEKQEDEEEEEQHEDDKLYCVCKTKYDEDRFMIACDRCDEWYHTQCVNMLDLEVDLVDQFICPPCVEKNPHLPLRTTYKQRCLYGLKHADPESPKACHKPARGAFSKYCSDECGVKYMQTRIDAWAKKGGKKDRLWESVKNAEKREGVVVLDDHCKQEEQRPVGIGKPKKSKVEKEVERLNLLLDQVVRLREEVKKGMEVVVWREKLLELATERAEQVGQCGWDQRLCFGDDEWSDFGAGVLESYEDAKVESGSSQADMQVDGAVEEDGEWWCPGKSMCDRHNGWQAVRHRDVCKEKEKKEDALLNLTTREREIRKRIEDIIDPHGHNCNDIVTKSPLRSINTKLTNGHAKGKINGDITKKGKKRKAP